MAASAYDYFIKVRQNFSTTIGSGGVAAADTTTFPLTSVVNLPTDTGIELVINRVDSAGAVTNNYETIRGVVSGSNLVNCVRGVEGTAQAWSAGTVVEYLVTADIQNRLVTGLLVEHSQSGIHSTSTFGMLAGDQTFTGGKTFAQTAVFQSATTFSGGATFSQSAIFGQSALFQSGIYLNGVKVPSISSTDTQTNKTFTSPLFTGTLDGWISTGTFTYASADAPTYTITVASGAASIYNVGDRIKLTQATGGVKYFIITAVADTVLTVYGGTDYALVNEAITAPYYSHNKSPLGFPLSPTKWTVEVTDTADRTQATPTQNTWYNPNSNAITIPIGTWRVFYDACLATGDSNLAGCDIMSTLSTANNSASDAQFTTDSLYLVPTAGAISQRAQVHREKVLVLAAKTPYYFNIRTQYASVDNIYVLASTGANLLIQAICAYL